MEANWQTTCQEKQLYYRKYCYTTRIDNIIKNEVDRQNKQKRNTYSEGKLFVYDVYRIAVQKAMLNQLQVICFIYSARHLQVNQQQLMQWAAQYESLLPQHLQQDVTSLKCLQIKLLLLAYVTKLNYSDGNQAYLELVFNKIHPKFTHWKNETSFQNVRLKNIILQHQALKPTRISKPNYSSLVDEVLRSSVQYNKQQNPNKKPKIRKQSGQLSVRPRQRRTRSRQHQIQLVEESVQECSNNTRAL